MRRRLETKAVPLALAAGSFLLVFLQQPGWASSDTKIDLHVDPAGFLGEVAALWNPTGSLGHIHGAQHGGYLFPMGPFFALLDGLGVSPWVAQRLWLGAVLALAAWGTVRLLDATLSPRRGVAHLVAGAITVLNPYVVVFANRTSVFLLGYAALPWVLLAAQRGLREPRRWRWPAVIGLITSASGGGVNAASVAWVVIAPALLVLYEPLVAAVGWRDAGRFALRAAVAVAVASIWWLAPLAGHALYGIDFLQFTEQQGTIWNTTSLSESLRLMGYWISYLGVGYGDTLQAYFSDSGTLLFDSLVVAATLLVPGLAVAGLAWTRRWRYGPFFLLLLLAGLLAMFTGFPEGTPLRRALNFAYNRVELLQTLRTTYKAGPLVAVAVACLAGAATAELVARLRALVPPGRRRAVLAGAGVLSAALVALSAWPFFQGEALDKQTLWKRIPPAWTESASELDRRLEANTRAVVLPAQPFAFYRWGATVDPILPALSERPVAARNTPPYADLHAVDLLWTVDGLVQQQRLVPGQLPPLLDLMAAGSVVAGTDDRVERSGAIPPAEAARALRGQPGFDSPSAEYGPVRSFPARPEELDPPVPLPQVRRYDQRGGRGLVDVVTTGRETVVDGSAEALAGLAAFGALPPAGPLLYAGDAGAAEIRAAAARGAELVVSDSNRRRVLVASRTRQTTGATLAAEEELPEDGARIDPFEDAGTSGQTVAVYRGARAVRAPLSPGFAQFPEQRPFAAFDGSPATAWLADPALEPDRHWVEVEFERPRDVRTIELLPYDDPRARVKEVTVAGRRFGLHRGWNRLRLGARDLDSLRVDVVATDPPKDEAESAGGIAEVRVPGLRVRELLRTPRLVGRAVAGMDLTRAPLTYVLSRTTADDPYRADRFPTPVVPRGNRDRSEAEAELVRSARDAERGLSRLIEVPSARAFRAQAWVSADPAAPDTLLDRLAGTATPGLRFTSSSRYRNQAGVRASRAFDGRAGSAWVASAPSGRAPWIEWRTQAPARVQRLRLVGPEEAVRVPTGVRLSWPGGVTPRLPVADGAVELPRPVRGARFRLTVTDSAFPPGTPRRARARVAVGIAEIRGAGVPRAPVTGPAQQLAGRCGDAALEVGGATVLLRPAGTVEDLEHGPLRAEGCREARLGRGRHELTTATGALLVDHLRLHSPARSEPVRGAGGGLVLDPGRSEPGRYEDVRVQLGGPAWLILRESYNRGWRASCDGRSLGEPKVVDGFANGWRAPGDCRSVDLTFAPERGVTAGYIAGGLACLVLLAVALVGLLRGGRAPRAAPAEAAGTPTFPAAGPPEPWPLRRALGAGVVAAAALGFVFALRAGMLIAPAVALVLWRGVGARALLLAAGALLALVLPALYLLFPAEDRGGYNTEYAQEHLGAHWVAVAAVVLLVLALWRLISTARARRDGRAGAPADADEARSPA